MNDKVYHVAHAAVDMLFAVGFMADDLTEFGPGMPDVEKQRVIDGFKSLCTYAAKGMEAELSNADGGK